MPHKMCYEFLYVLLNENTVLCFWDFFKNLDQSHYVFYKNIIPSNYNFTFRGRWFWILWFWHNFIWFKIRWRWWCFKVKFIAWFFILSFNDLITIETFVNISLHLLLMLEIFLIHVRSFCGHDSNKIASSLILLSNLFQYISILYHSKLL